MHLIKFTADNESYVNFSGDRGIIYELKEKYSFHAPNYQYDKRFQMGYWDGRISLINLKDKRFLRGLLPDIKEYLDEEKIEYLDETNSTNGFSMSPDQVRAFYREIKGPFEPHDSQVESFRRCIEDVRNIILAPTSLGKSYIIHGLNAYYKIRQKRTLIIIHRSQLVLQLKSNFIDEYNCEDFYTVSTIYDDQEVIDNSDILISTWQSLKDKDEDYFNKFDVVICDEVHTAKAKSVINIFDKCTGIKYRHGFTATLDNDSKVDALTLRGLFGNPYTATTLKKQIAAGVSVKPTIYAVVVKYGVEIRKELQRQITEARKAGEGNSGAPPDFKIESKFLEGMDERNQLIAKIASAQSGNTLIAFKNSDHGKAIYEIIKDQCKHDHFFVNGTISKTKRFDIQKKITELKESTSVVSFGTFSTGINIPNLNNLIIGSQVKSAITVPQLIGRMIRNSEGKTGAIVVDICDDLTHNNKENIFLKHFRKRLEFYMKNQFTIHKKVITIT